MNRADRIRLQAEFDRQVENLLQKGYPKVAGVKPTTFVKQLAPLKKKIGKLDVPAVDLGKGRLPFVIVIDSEWVAAKKGIALVEREGKKGYTQMIPREPDDFKPIDSVEIPVGKAYLLVDIDRGQKTLNVRPNDALKRIKRNKRSPLTIAEGVAIVTHYPDFIMKNNCFSLLASRHSGDQRVPALWITAEKRVRLGWCWDGNPHTWLGSASCAGRIGM